jgi:hypothetical protein
MARTWGGTQTIELKPGERVMNCTFKEDDIWLLLRNDSASSPDTCFFVEQSSYGLLEGRVVIVEK